MANIWENAVITNKGVELQAKIIAGGEITITSVRTGAGTVPVSQLYEQLAVSNVKQTATIQPIKKDGNTVTIPVLVTNIGLNTAYNLRQVGFYATDPDEGEILYAIAQNTEPRQIPAEAESPGYTLTWKFRFTMSNNVNLNASVDLAGIMTTKDPTGTGSFSMNRKAGTTVGKNSHTEGTATTASADFSHAEGNGTTASGPSAHSEGSNTEAKGSSSHAEGSGSQALGPYSHAEGYYTKCGIDAMYAHSEGYQTEAKQSQHVQGHWNDTSLAVQGTTGGTAGTSFIIGNGTQAVPSNALRVTYAGEVIGKKAYASTGADYAEFFEWQDGNPEAEDRVGYFVTFADGRYIRKAEAGEYILGIVSGNPCVLGNHDECWMGQNEMDEWGRFIYDTIKVKVENPETGEEEEVEATTYRINPDFDRNQKYIPRQERPEWSAIGMLGALAVRDDGTCQVNGYCECAAGGIATAAERGTDTYRVIERIADNIIKVILK